jgi:pimeloyl-ACP methyl ester carboxylesterase
MAAVAAAGYRAISFDMRGYGESSKPENPALYTIFYFVGDLVGILAGLGIDRATLVGHDRHMRPGADREWADAATTFPGMLYWASGLPDASERWDPMGPKKSLNRPSPIGIPSFASREDVEVAIAGFERDGFHGPLNIYRAMQSYFEEAGAFAGAKVRQPAFFAFGTADGMIKMRALEEGDLAKNVPNLKGFLRHCAGRKHLHGMTASSS